MVHTIKHNELKSDSFLLKVSLSDHDKIRKAAEIMNISKSEFVLGLALRKADEVLNKSEFDHIQKLNGEWGFRNRKLKVFENFYLLASSEYSDADWADLYSLPLSAVREARQLCEHLDIAAYTAWVESYEKEDE